MNNLVKMTRSAYATAKANRTLVTPNVALITDENKVEYLPVNPTSDIGIAAYDGGVRKYYSLDEWNALATKPTALGVYVFTEQSQFIIHGTLNTSVKWSNNTTVAVPDVVTTTQNAAALLDFAGAANTQAVLDAVTGGVIEDAPLFTWARGLSFADGSTPYIPAAGELELIRLNLTEINACRAALGQDPIVFEGRNVWSSTQYNAGNAWSWNSSSWRTNLKSYPFFGVAVCAL